LKITKDGLGEQIARVKNVIIHAKTNKYDPNEARYFLLMQASSVFMQITSR